MQIRNPHYRELVSGIFSQAPFIRLLGAQLTGCGPGWAESSLALKADTHLQQNGYVHAGVQATLADHTAGAAAATLAADGIVVLTIEFKINLLTPAYGDNLTCRADVLKSGANIVVVESQVFANASSTVRLVSKATVTIANVATSA